MSWVKVGAAWAVKANRMHAMRGATTGDDIAIRGRCGSSLLTPGAGAPGGALRAGIFVARTLDNALAGASGGCGLTELFDGRVDVTTHKRPLRIALTRELDVPHRLPIALEHTIRVGQG